MRHCLPALLVLACLSPRESDANSAILDIIPDDCLGYVILEDIERLDSKLAPLLEELNAGLFRPQTLIRERLNLGPQIPGDSPIAAVLMPADNLPELGALAVLVVRCPDVAAWLADFNAQRLEDDLWQAELVWGPTFVAAHKGFAILGSTSDAVKAVRSAARPITDRVSQVAVGRTSAPAIQAWLRWSAVAKSQLADAWMASLAPQNALLGRTLLNDRAELLRQIDGVHLAVSITGPSANVHLAVAPQPGTPLAQLTAFGNDTADEMLGRLPQNDQLMVAGAATMSSGQSAAFQQVLGQLLTSPVFTALNAELAGEFKSRIAALAGQLRGVAWQAAATPPNPQGMAVASGLLRVGDASAWVKDFEGTIKLLNTSLVPEGQQNPFFESLVFTPAAEMLHGFPVHHVRVRLHAVDNNRKALSWAAMFGETERVLRLTLADPFTVAWTVGGQTADMDRLIATALGRAPGLPAPAASAPAIALCSPTALANVGRVLARTQHNIAKAPARTPPAPLITTTATFASPFVHIDIPVSFEALLGIQALMTPGKSKDIFILPQG